MEKEIQKLLKRVDHLRQETEKLIEDAKALSAAGLREAEHKLEAMVEEQIIDRAKDNWKTLLGLATGLGMFLKGKKPKRKIKKGQNPKKAAPLSTVKKRSAKK